MLSETPEKTALPACLEAWYQHEAPGNQGSSAYYVLSRHDILTGRRSGAPPCLQRKRSELDSARIWHLRHVKSPAWTGATAR